MSTGFDQWCWGQNIFYAGFGFTNWTNDVINDLVLNDDGTVEFICASDNYREALTTYFHEWYSEGLMDVEMFTQSDTQLISKCSQGYVGVSTWWYIEELMGDYASDYVFLPILDGPDGKQLLMYTGVARQTQPDGGMKEVQTQCLAVGDGCDYEKYAANPVITADDLPEGCSRFDFRDPKIWREDDGTYTCVVGNRPADGSGQLLLFTSDDAFSWRFKSILAQNENRIGKMWECPDLFELDGKWVILTSPQDMMPAGFEYHNGNGTLCLIGSYDRENGTFFEEADQSIDYGIDFYAPQTILTPDGRRVMIGWMQNWDTCNFHKPEKPWFGQMSLPRELSVKNGRLIQTPIRELESLRTEKVTHDNVRFSGEQRFYDVSGRRLDLTVTVRPGDTDRIYHKFEVVFAENETYRSHISFRPYEQIVKIDRKFSGSRRAIIHQRRCFTGSGEDGRIKMRIILDCFSVEVFINDGEKVLTATLYTDLAADGILFFADGEVVMDVESYGLTR